MAQKVTLGGDRLGSGKKMKVHLHGYERSTHNLGYVWRSTMSAGTLVPFMSEVALPGDTFDIDLDADVKTHPTVGPLFGSYKVQLDVFQCPIRLYNSYLHNNQLNIGLKMSDIKLPQIIMTAVHNESIGATTDLDNAQINPSCLLKYLGMSGIGINTTDANLTRSFNGTPIICYWDIVKNYYTNKQEEIGAVIHTPAVTLVETVDLVTAGLPGSEVTIPENSGASQYMTSGMRIGIDYSGGPAPIPSQLVMHTIERGDITLEALAATPYSDNGSTLLAPFRQTYWGNLTFTGWNYRADLNLNQGKPKVVTFPLENIDKMRSEILLTPGNTVFTINELGLPPYIYLVERPNGIPNILSSQEGLALKTYQSDLFNNWLQTEWIDGVNGITAVTAIDTSDGKFTLDTLNLSQKVYNMLNRIAVSGGTYNDWLDAVYDHNRYTVCSTPMYMGGLIKELVFQEVVSNSESDTQPLGTLAGRGVMAKKHKGGKVRIKVDEPSYILGIISITPRIDYSQGNKWDLHLQTIDDLHKPALDEIGFQELITEQMTWWSTKYNDATDVWETRSAGKQPAWLNYMTNVNQVRGNFAIATNEMFMTLNRRYEADTATFAIKDLTTYIDPSKFNFIFAETSLDAQNFWAQISVDITARRKMSAKIMPNL